MTDPNVAMSEAHRHPPDPQASSSGESRDDDVFVFPASFGQERLWILDRLERNSAQYNIPAAYRLRGALNKAALEQSLDQIISRHEVLRTTFANQDGQTVQLIARASKLECPLVDLERHPAREAELERLILREAQQPFNLETGPLLRATLYRLGPEEHLLSLTAHHVAFDGWSSSVLDRELNLLYEALSQGRPSPLPELPIQYADYATWQREWLKGAELHRQLDYWKQQLAGLSVLELPTDRPRPRIESHRGDVRYLSISPEVTSALRALGRRQHATLFMTLTAGLQTLLHRYSGQDDIALGVPMAGRNRPEVEGLIGFFVDTLVLRGNLSGDPTFLDLLARVRDTTFEMFAHRDLPFEKLVEELRPQRDMSRNPLFQVVFAWEDLPAAELELTGVTSTPVAVHTKTAKFDLTLALNESGEGLQGVLEYSTDLFDASTIDRMCGHFQTLLEGIAASPEARLSELPLLTEAERRQLLVDWNATGVDYPRDKTVAQLFEEQAARTPEAVALVCRDQVLTYRELDGRANQLGRQLRGLGVGPDVLVGICTERSIEMVVGLLGILKAGGAYVPLDPTYPRERLAFMLADTRVPVLLTEQALLPQLPAFEGRTLCLDRDWPTVARLSAEAVPGAATAGNLAYVMYTSGSTGVPKGVEVCHRGIVRLVCGARYARFGADRTFLLLAPISFDASTFELWGALLHGARCAIYPERVPTPLALGEAIRRHGVTTLWLTASLFNVIVDEKPDVLASVSELLTGGEALSVPHVRRAQERLPRTQLINGFGPTESTTFTCCYPIPRPLPEPLSSVPIGRPIANTRVYILDKALRPVPVGVPGELYIGGDGLARAYLNRPELTAEKFIGSPVGERPEERLYRTGDLARYLPDGRIEFLGRLDDQVKLRGYRIELGEIEATLAECAGVQHPVVVMREDKPGEKRLVAYFTTDPDRRPPAVELRRFLEAKLPEYMVPAAFVPLDALPLTPSGKVDRKRLPAPEPHRQDLDGSFQPPRTRTETLLAGIYAEILKLRRVGVHDSFFELGGDSLSAVRLMLAIEQRCGVDLPPHTLFQAPTVARLAEKLTDVTGGEKLAEAAGAPRVSAAAGCTEPRTPTERRLLAIWERLLGVRPIGMRDSFLDLEGDPGLFDQMLEGIKREFGGFAEGFPAEVDNPTIETLARMIDDNVQPPTLVICLQPHGSKRPLFLIHHGAGYVFFFRALAARLGPDRPVYGVRAETKSDGLGHPYGRSRSIEEVAARYIGQIKTIQPRGPYFLGGGCAGGVIAFEMARQLRSQGETVGPVLLFDAVVLSNRHAPGPAAPSVGGSPVSLQGRIARQLDRASHLGVMKAAWYLGWKVLRNVPSETAIAIRATRRKMEVVAADLEYWLKWVVSRSRGRALPVELVQHRILEGFLRKSGRLLLRYIPGVFDGSIVLFKAAESQGPEPLWTGLARGGVVVHTVEGRHMSMMEEPAVRSTAVLVRDCLDRAEDADAGARSSRTGVR